MIKKQSLQKVLSISIALSCVLSLPPAAAETAAAGKVVSATAGVKVVGASGQARSLAKDDTLSAGDTLDTGDGRAQVRFADGGVVALSPRTQFRIDEYNYSGSEDGSERSFFSLVKGGFRAISGAIGHRNPESYHVKTLVATIGIRGTAYQAQLCDPASQEIKTKSTDVCEGLKEGLHVQTDEGTTNVSNDAGSLDVPSGKRAYVPDNNTAPAFVEDEGEQPDLTRNLIDDPGFRAGENPVQLSAPPSPPEPPPPPPPPPPSIPVSPGPITEPGATGVQ